MGGDSEVGLSVRSRVADQVSSGLLLGLNRHTFWTHVLAFSGQTKNPGGGVGISLSKSIALRCVVLRF